MILKQTALFLLCALGAIPAHGLERDTVELRRGEIVIYTSGTIVPADIFRLKSTIEGRTEIFASTGIWAYPNQDLGLLLNREFAALMDSYAGTPREVLASRWPPAYQPSNIRCPSACCVLKSFVKSGKWVKPWTALFEAAAHLHMVGHVRPDEAHLVHDGMILEYWAAQKPAKHFQIPVSRYVLDAPAGPDPAGGTFTIVMGPDQFLPPQTPWEGFIARKTNVLVVPAGALSRFGDNLYLKVSTGTAAPDGIEITSVIGAVRKMLFELGYSAATNPAASTVATSSASVAAPFPGKENARPKETARPYAPPRQRRGLEEIREPDAKMGEDPYSE